MGLLVSGLHLSRAAMLSRALPPLLHTTPPASPTTSEGCFFLIGSGDNLNLLSSLLSPPTPQDLSPLPGAGLGPQSAHGSHKEGLFISQGHQQVRTLGEKEELQFSKTKPARTESGCSTWVCPSDMPCRREQPAEMLANSPLETLLWTTNLALVPKATLACTTCFFTLISPTSLVERDNDKANKLGGTSWTTLKAFR